jgi:hypothetical protein
MAILTPDPISPSSDRDGLWSSAALPYAGERIFMRHHDTWLSAFVPWIGLSGVFGPVGTELCAILQSDFAELPFYDVG